MTDPLIRIKRAVLDGRLVFTEKANVEMERDGLSERDVEEALMNAPAVVKTLRSTAWKGRREYLYVVPGMTFDGVFVYTKGKFVNVEGEERFYLLISSKHLE